MWLSSAGRMLKEKKNDNSVMIEESFSSQLDTEDIDMNQVSLTSQVNTIPNLEIPSTSMTNLNLTPEKLPLQTHDETDTMMTIERQLDDSTSERVSAVAAVAGAAPRRHLWEWVTFMFNKPDQERIAAFGADRACAEWVLRNGGKVALEGGQRIDNYNSLPDENVRFRLEVIDATDSAISHYGFPHLRNCTGIKSIKLVGCGYVGDEALSQLRLVAESLECLEIVDCKNLTDEGLRQIIALAKLKSVRISQLPYVRDLAGEKEAIQAALPGCRVE